MRAPWPHTFYASLPLLALAGHPRRCPTPLLCPVWPDTLLPLPSLVGVPLTSPWALPSSCCPWCLPSSHLDLNMPVPPTPPTHEGPCLFSSEAANPQLSFSPFCSGPGHWSLVTSAYEWPQPPTPQILLCVPSMAFPGFSDSWYSPACLALGLFPRRLHPQSPPVQLHGMTVPVPCPFALFKIFRHLPGVNSLGLLRSECVHVITHHPSTV